MNFSEFVRKTAGRPMTVIFGWGMCAFGILAGVGAGVSTFAFNDDFAPHQRVVLCLASILAFMLGGILWGAIMWLLFGRVWKKRAANQPSEGTR